MRGINLENKRGPDVRNSGTSLWAAGLLALAVLAAYADGFSVPFFFDDTVATVANPSVRHLWPPWAPLLPPAESPTGGRPILNLSFALNYAVSGFNVWSYHVFNLLVHILAGLVLLGVVRRTLLQPILRGKFGADSLPLALAIALLWALHPLQTESVTYVSQRAESLMGLFYLLTLYAFIRAAEAGPHRLRWSVVSVAACFLGMATKEVMATAPLMVLIYDRTFIAGSFREAWQQRRLLYAGLAASWLVLIDGFWDMGKRAVGFGHGVTPWSYAMTECGVLIHYVALVFWPHPLVIDYGYGEAGDLRQVLAPALVLTALLVIVGVAFVRHPAAGFAGIWFFVILAVTSSVIPVVLSPMAEHRLYLPLAAPVTLVVLGLYAGLGRWGLGAAAGLTIVCGAITFARNEDYRAEVPLWEEAVNLHPDNARARNNLGYILLQKGQVEAALAQCRQAVDIAPDLADARNNLGNALLQAGRDDDALAQYRKALELRPGYAEAHYNLANIFLTKGQADEALAEYQKALEIDPGDAEVHNNLGKVLVLKGRMDEALTQFQMAVELDPGSAEAHNNLGNVLLDKGRVDEAVAQYQAALAINPGLVRAQDNLAKAQALARQAANAK